MRSASVSLRSVIPAISGLPRLRPRHLAIGDEAAVRLPMAGLRRDVARIAPSGASVPSAGRPMQGEGQLVRTLWLLGPLLDDLGHELFDVRLAEPRLDIDPVGDEEVHVAIDRE